jgi:signal transduction histidine kinase
MKLLNQTLLYLSVPIFLVISIWAVVFYSNMFHEIYDSIDDGLDNYKLLIIQKSKRDSSVLFKHAFDEGNYAMRKISRANALSKRDVYQDTSMYMLNEEKMEPVRMLTTAFQHKEEYYELKVISSMIEEDDQIANLSRAALWLYVLLLISIVLINNIVLQKLWKPFYELLEKLKTFRVDRDSTIPAIKTQTLEFKELKNATDTLIEHTVETYRNQKNFIENAAHELQTPLAVITNKLELLLENNNLNEEDSTIIAQVMNTTSQLVKLNKSLLLLSKIENKQFFDNRPIVLNQLVQIITTELEAFTSFRDIALTIEEKEEAKLNMDAHLAYVLVVNLIKNAVFHNTENGSVLVTIEQKRLTVANTSSREALDEQRVFKRFHKTSNKQNSTGLGLAIVKAICDLYGFKITYHFNAGQHFFTVKFR